MGERVSAHEMYKAGVAVDNAASEWTPCRSDGDKAIDYAKESAKKNLLADYHEEMKEIAQGRQAGGEVAA
jgi:hypothetical protein